MSDYTGYHGDSRSNVRGRRGLSTRSNVEPRARYEISAAFLLISHLSSSLNLLILEFLGKFKGDGEKENLGSGDDTESEEENKD